MSEYQFLQDATLDTVVPQASNLNIEELLRSMQESSGDLGTCLTKIQQRQLLFFGMDLIHSATGYPITYTK